MLVEQQEPAMLMEQQEPSCSGATSKGTGEFARDVDSSNDGPKDAATQTEELEYMFFKPIYQAPDREYFKSDDKVRFYTGLPSYQVLLTTLNHVAPHVNRRSQSLDPFQEFVMVLMKLRLNVPLISRSCLPIHGISAYCFSDLLVMDQCHGQQIESTHSLARQGKSLENNANVFQICVWKQGYSNY